MTAGPGKYDQECTAALVATGAQTVLLIVLDGDRGSGFSLSAVGGVPKTLLLPQLLRQVADDIDADIAVLAADPERQVR